MEKRTMNKEQKVFVEKCDICGTEIVGTSESQVQWNMKIHKQSKHNKENK